MLAPAGPSPSDPGAGPAKTVLFTAFEPSGDDHAAAVIAALRAARPDVSIAAWGGRKMEAAGARIIERTGEDAVMGLPGLAKIREHRRLNQRVERWLDANPVRAHVAVDSPAANFPICALAKARRIPVLHLAAPQIWAWGAWRIRKMRRLTDMILCFLPFEEGWFTTRGVPARFIGHPLFDDAIDTAALDRRAAALPAGPRRMALMPGSRPAEWHKNFPVMLDAFAALRRDRPGLVGAVAATTPGAAHRLREIAAEHGGWPDGLAVMVADTDAVIRWCELALVVSGTVTLQIARQHRPMVVVYRASRLLYHALARWIVSARYFALPNLLAGREVVPEFIPHFGGAGPLIAEAAELLDSPDRAAVQRAELEKITGRFEGHRAASAAAQAILEVARLG